MPVEGGGEVDEVAGGMRVQVQVLAQPAGGAAPAGDRRDVAGVELADEAQFQGGGGLLEPVRGVEALDQGGVGGRPEWRGGVFHRVPGQFLEPCQHVSIVEHPYDTLDLAG